MVFCDWLLSVISKMFSNVMHVAAWVSTSFLFMAEYYFIALYCILRIPSSVDGQLACFHFLGIINSAAMNVCVKIFVWI